jgi:hypothetical protein
MSTYLNLLLPAELWNDFKMIHHSMLDTLSPGNASRVPFLLKPAIAMNYFAPWIRGFQASHPWCMLHILRLAHPCIHTAWWTAIPETKETILEILWWDFEDVKWNYLGGVTLVVLWFIKTISIYLFIIFIAGCHLGFLEAAHAHQVPGRQNALRPQ